MNQKLFAYSGAIAFATLLGTMAIAAGLHLRGMVNAWALPLKAIAAFLGGARHTFNGFAHNPVAYARHATCPTLILHGVQDKWTNVEDVEAILENLGSSSKQLVLFPDAGHQLLIGVDRELWQTSVEQFLAANLAQLTRL